jgi:hypothetical protein
MRDEQTIRVGLDGEAVRHEPSFVRDGDPHYRICKPAAGLARMLYAVIALITARADHSSYSLDRRQARMQIIAFMHDLYLTSGTTRQSIESRTLKRRRRRFSPRFPLGRFATQAPMIDRRAMEINRDASN